MTWTLALALLLAAGTGAPPPPPGAASSPAATSSATEPRDAARPSAPEAPLARPAREGRQPSALLGRWAMQSEPGKVLELKSGGTGTFHGFPITWSVEGSRLTVTDPSGTDTTAWRVTGDRLVLTGPFGIEIVFRRKAARP